MEILYVTTLSITINTFLIPHIEYLLDQGHLVDIACNVNREISSVLTNRGCKVFSIEFQRSPLKMQNHLAYKKLKELICKGEYDLVHTHTPIASACVRLACKNMNNVKVFYTAHGFHFFKGAPIKNWLIYYPIEKWLSRYTDTLITINREDYERARRSFKAKRVKYIPGIGIDVNKFKLTKVDKKTKRKEIGIPEDGFLVLTVGELNKNKNHETIIRAIAELYNSKIHYAICGKGMLEGYLKNLAIKLGLERNIHILGFRNDIAEICKVSDVFVFPSKREGLGLAALEAMACGLPIITSNIHGIVDYSLEGITGYTCKPIDVHGFGKAINILHQNEELRLKFGRHNYKLAEKFDNEVSMMGMRKIYEEVLFDY